MQGPWCLSSPTPTLGSLSSSTGSLMHHHFDQQQPLQTETMRWLVADYVSDMHTYTHIYIYVHIYICTYINNYYILKYIEIITCTGIGEIILDRMILAKVSSWSLLSLRPQIQGSPGTPAIQGSFSDQDGRTGDDVPAAVHHWTHPRTENAISCHSSSRLPVMAACGKHQSPLSSSDSHLSARSALWRG